MLQYRSAVLSILRFFLRRAVQRNNYRVIALVRLKGNLLLGLEVFRFQLGNLQSQQKITSRRRGCGCKQPENLGQLGDASAIQYIVKMLEQALTGYTSCTSTAKNCKNAFRVEETEAQHSELRVANSVGDTHRMRGEMGTKSSHIVPLERTLPQVMPWSRRMMP